MRTIILAVGLLCLLGCVFPNSFPSIPSIEAVVFNQQTSNDGENKKIAEEADKIVGGTAALVGEFPYQAALNLSGRLCGGTLISTSIILTAAHCLKGLSADSASTFKVTVNTTKLKGGTDAISTGVRKFVMHASFNPNTFDNDIALLSLSAPITNVKIAKLPLANTTSTYAGQLAVIVGWGKTSFSGGISTNLLKTTVNVLTNTACIQQHGDRITSKMVCAAGPGKSVCYGDSGGPMMVEGVHIGITSFGIGCADPRFAAVYTRVTDYLTWIKTISNTI